MKNILGRRGSNKASEISRASTNGNKCTKAAPRNPFCWMGTAGRHPNPDESCDNLILVVEDDDINRMTTRLMLERAGYSVLEVVDGASALAIMKEYTFCLVIMDINLPVLSGKDATMAIRQGECGEKCVSIPIIAVTAYSHDNDRDTILDAGADAYLTKPVDFTILIDEIKRFL